MSFSFESLVKCDSIFMLRGKCGHAVVKSHAAPQGQLPWDFEASWRTKIRNL